MNKGKLKYYTSLLNVSLAEREELKAKLQSTDITINLLKEVLKDYIDFNPSRKLKRALKRAKEIWMNNAEIRQLNDSWVIIGKNGDILK